MKKGYTCIDGIYFREVKIIYEVDYPCRLCPFARMRMNESGKLISVTSSLDIPNCNIIYSDGISLIERCMKANTTTKKDDETLWVPTVKFRD